ncbi:MAG TPA: PKD domain-containing protein [Bacteroidia bacterium]|nr:PKD domain-containing protein [Bacteroidia bacterium]
MNWLRLLICIPVLFFFSHCEKKKYPETTRENNPEFYARLALPSGEIKLEAGIEDYWMFSGFSQDSSGLYHYQSEFRPKSCTGACPNSLYIEISDTHTMMPSAPADINSALHTGFYTFSSPSWKVSFQSQYNKTATAYRWSFGDGIESTLPNPVHTYAVGGRYNVCLSVLSGEGCESTICSPLDIGYPDDHCTVFVDALQGAGNSILFSAQVKGVPTYTFDWDFGDGQRSSVAQPNHSYAVPGAYPVSLRVSDSKGNTSQAWYNAVTSGDNSSCAANLKVPLIQSEATLLPYARVRISYRSASGILYSSDAFTQDPANKFEVLSVSDFDQNEKGEPTKKLNVKFSGYLYNGQNSIYISESEAVICVSYKN